MIEIHNAALGRTIDVDRIIGKIKGEEPGPTIIFFAGIHGNESSGVFALRHVLDELSANEKPVKGNIYGIGGNLDALENGERFCEVDLNRIWTDERLKVLPNQKNGDLNTEIRQQKEIFNLIGDILQTESGPFYFMDLHTTSSETIPFVMVNDSLLNRKFAEQFPVPMILGIEEYIDGALLSYINELGYVSFGYEAGQHTNLASYENQVAFIYLSMAFSGIVDANDIDYYHHYEKLARTSITSKDIYEIHARFKLNSGDDFTMQPGFVNFQKVRKGQQLASRNKEKIKALHSGRIFMPLYQNQGKEGFFEIRRVRRVFLRLSEVLRHTKFDHILPFLPGIRWKSDKHEALIVNLRVARFFTKQFLHLLGYRSKQVDKNHLIIKNREAASKVKEYEEEAWYLYSAK